LNEGISVKNDYFKKFLSMAKKVHQKTIREKGSRNNLWFDLREKWINHYKEIPPEVIEQRTRLLMAVSYTECFQSLFWIENLVKQGAYNQAIRDLRTMLESVIQALYRIECGPYLSFSSNPN
jgi:hypothetical protein